MLTIARFLGWLTNARPQCKRHDWCQFKGRFVCAVCEKRLR